MSNSGDPLIDALDSIEEQLATLTAAVTAADPVQIGRRAEEGAKAGAAKIVFDLRSEIEHLDSEINRLDAAREGLDQAVDVARIAVDERKQLSWWKAGVMALATLLVLLVTFAGGYVVASYDPSPKNLNEAGCKARGGFMGTVENKPVCAFPAKP